MPFMSLIYIYFSTRYNWDLHIWNGPLIKRVLLFFCAALWNAPARLGSGQPASQKRLMAHRPHLDPFISCFQNDISLATEDQQAWQEQRRSVSQSQTNTGNENMPRSRQAETDRATMDPPLTSAKTLWSTGQGQVDERIFMACFGDSLFIEEPGRGLLSSWGLRLDHTAQM